MSDRRALVLPFEQHAALFVWDGARLARCEGVRVPIDSPWAASIESDLLCFGEGASIRCVDGAFSGDFQARRALRTSSDRADVLALNIKDSVLYVGGRFAHRPLGMFDLDDPAPRWTPIRTSDVVSRNSVDEILIDGDRLVALDNILVPKWWIQFEIRDARRPHHVREVEIGPVFQEWFTHAALGERLIITSSHQTYRGRMLRFFDRRTLAELVSTNYGSKDSRAAPDRMKPWLRDRLRRFDVRGEQLCFGAGWRGVCVADLRPIRRGLREAAMREAMERWQSESTRWITREDHWAASVAFCDDWHIAISWLTPANKCEVELVAL